jgi:hypothetical protein
LGSCGLRSDIDDARSRNRRTVGRVLRRRLVDVAGAALTLDVALELDVALTVDMALELDVTLTVDGALTIDMALTGLVFVWKVLDRRIPPVPPAAAPPPERQVDEDP